ncbi:hypothetical protein C8J57DRAFT_1234799 [Mycena rebaudengoi]|nr:hypothetical protein C8J57DRAFT_1234799 [Mycena rebaudengoi]
MGTAGKKPRRLAIVAVLKKAEEAELGRRGSATEAADGATKKLRILKDVAVAGQQVNLDWENPQKYRNGDRTKGDGTKHTDNCGTVGAGIVLCKALWRKNHGGDNTYGDVAKDIQTDSRHLVKRTDNSFDLLLTCFSRDSSKLSYSYGAGLWYIWEAQRDSWWPPAGV